MIAALTAVVALAPAPTPLHETIDRLVAAGHAGPFAPPAADAEFLRRATLDLAGTLPSVAEARGFPADPSPAKRQTLIDRLLAGPGYARRMTHVFDVTLMERRPDGKVARAAWEDYLRAAFAANKPYDQLVREILAGDGADPATRAAAKFYLDREMDPTLVVRDVSRVFLGKNLQCAQCHDHPQIDDYKQADFYGLLAFVNRSFLFPDAKAATAVVAEKADGDVTFVSVFDPKKVTKATGPKLPGGKAVDEPKMDKGKEYKVAPAKDVRPVPAYSRRAELAKRITAPDNPAFARTAANRVWAALMGRGLVHPLDLDHSDNPPSHPELLDLLAAEFVAHGYDVKYLVREIALSQTYQRSSEPPAGADVPADRFAVAALKPLSAEQLGYALVQATGTADVDRAAAAEATVAARLAGLGAAVRPVVPGDPAEAAVEARLAARVAPFRSAYGGRAGTPDDGTAPTLDQTLFVKHGGTVRGLVAHRAAAKPTDPGATADELFLAALTRLPTADERADAAAALAGPDKAAAVGEVLWALVASAEFRFNH
jgi:hypothetical protein